MLGLQVGRLPSELSQTMTAAEETTLLAFYKEDPWGDHRADIRSAGLSQILYNQNVKKQDRKKLTDFLPFYKKPVKVDVDVGKKVKDHFTNLIGKK